MLLPVVGHLGVDHTRCGIPHRFGVAVLADRAEHGVPDAELLGGSAMRTHDFFVANSGLHDCLNLPSGSAHLAARHGAERAAFVEGVLILVNVHQLVGAKVDWVGTIAISAIVEVGIENLRSGSLPATG